MLSELRSIAEAALLTGFSDHPLWSSILAGILILMVILMVLEKLHFTLSIEQRHRTRLVLREHGFEKGKPTFEAAEKFILGDFRTRFELARDLRDLTVQHPLCFALEIDAIASIYEAGHMPPRVSSIPSRTLGSSDLILVSYLIRIYGGSKSAGNILKALSGLPVPENRQAMEILEVRQRYLGRDSPSSGPNGFFLPGAVLDQIKDHAGFVTCYLFALALFHKGEARYYQDTWATWGLIRKFAEMGFNREYLKSALAKIVEERYDLYAMNKHSGMSPAVTLGFPVVVGFRIEDPEPLLNRLNSDVHFKQIWSIAARLGKNREEFLACCDILERYSSLRHARSFFEAFSHFPTFCQSTYDVDLFAQVLARFYSFIDSTRLDFNYGIPRMFELVGKLKLADLTELQQALMDMARLTSRYPRLINCDFKCDGYGSALQLILNIDASPPEFFRRAWVCGHILEIVDQHPCYWNLFKLIDSAAEFSSSQCLSALSAFMEQVRRTSAYGASQYMRPNSREVLWDEFFRGNFFERIIKMTSDGVPFRVVFAISTEDYEEFDISYLSSAWQTCIKDARLEVELAR